MKQNIFIGISIAASLSALFMSFQNEDQARLADKAKEQNIILALQEKIELQSSQNEAQRAEIEILKMNMEDSRSSGLHDIDFLSGGIQLVKANGIPIGVSIERIQAQGAGSTIHIRVVNFSSVSIGDVALSYTLNNDELLETSILGEILPGRSLSSKIGIPRVIPEQIKSISVGYPTIGYFRYKK